MAVNESTAVDELPITNPVTGAIIATVPITSRADVRKAADRARAAQPAWMSLSVIERCRLLQNWANLMWRNRDQVRATIRSETGKTDAGAFLEIFVIDNLTAYYARIAPDVLRVEQRRPLFPLVQSARVYHQSLGLVGFITPWNYPLYNALTDLIPALLAGNACLLKPSERTPLTARYAVDLMHQAGIPDDVVQIITGDASTGTTLIDQVDFIAFTGSVDTGRKVGARAAKRLIPFSLELGGKDPLIILKDADIDLAATGTLRGALENAGQMCISVERVYVEAAIYDQFIDRLEHFASQLKLSAGDGMDVHVGSMTNERELLRTEAHIADAVEKGATLLYGGQRRPDVGPLFFEPTILIDTDHRMDVMREETFGPVVPVMKVADVDEAVRLANDSAYGLSASIYSQDLALAERVATRLECGDVSINRTQMVMATPSLPMGGRKNSGIGRRGGPEGLRRFVATQSVLVDKSIGAKPSLTFVEPLLYRAALMTRGTRRWLPFLRP
jgi:acyl-CoA reductase-like NAD-dependent aldehyde dehydrogenase